MGSPNGQQSLELSSDRIEQRLGSQRECTAVAFPDVSLSTSQQACRLRVFEPSGITAKLAVSSKLPQLQAQWEEGKHDGLACKHDQ